MVQGETGPDDNPAASSVQGCKKQRLGPASGQVSSATSNREGVVAIKSARGLDRMGRQYTTSVPHQIWSGGGGAFEVVAELADASPPAISHLFNYAEEATEGAMHDTSPP